MPSTSQVSEYLVTDDLTILLGLIAATVFLLNNLYKPQPLVHPILLGRQSDVARVRNPGESAVYRNYGTGLMGRFPLRPSKETHIIADLIRSEFESSRTLWSTRITNSRLQDRIAALGTGLLRLAALQPRRSRVLLLLNDSIEFLLTDFALASHSIVSYTLSNSKLLASVLDAHNPSAIITDAEMLHQVLELIYDSGNRTNSHTIIVVGEPTAQVLASVASNIKLVKFSEIEREGVRVEKIISSPPVPEDVYTVSFFETEQGHIQAAQFTHENMTAGVAATRALLPLTNTISSLDTVVSAHPLSTAFGRAIAYTAIYDGTSFATLQSSKMYHPDERDVGAGLDDLLSAKSLPIPAPTVYFFKPGHLEALASSVLKQSSKSFFLFPFARRHKLAGIMEGFLTKDSLWDRLVFDGARAKVIGEGAGTVRAVVVSGGPVKASLMTPARIALSVPIVNTFTHPLVPGPVLGTHPLDLQDFPAVLKDNLSLAMAHVGPPSVNTEVKLIGVSDALVEKGADPAGSLLIRGPSVGKLLPNDDYVSIPTEEDKEGWMATGVKARVQTNGSFQIA